MTAKPSGILLVAALSLLVATCGGGGGGPTSPGLEQSSSGQGQDGEEDQGPGDPGGGFGELTRCPTPGNPNKVVICHIPPGNPDNAHDICVDDSAVPAHLGHGDYLGECDLCPAGEPYCCDPTDPYCVGG